MAASSAWCSNSVRVMSYASCRRHAFMYCEDDRHRYDRDVSFKAGIHRLRYGPDEVERRSVRSLQRWKHVVIGQQPHRDAGGMRKIEKRRGRQPAAPEERVDLAVFQGIGRLRDAEALFLDIGGRVDAGGFENTECRQLAPAAR